MWALLPQPATADLTAFLGVSPTPENRTVRGIAVGISLLVVGFEFEYAATSEDESLAAPSLRTGMFNVLVQTPVAVSGLQFYGTAGGGLFRERLLGAQETHVGGNVGGGVKIGIAGPLRARIDYRIFNLRGSPSEPRPQRIYAGLNLAF